jgi:hypothetical protein
MVAVKLEREGGSTAASDLLAILAAYPRSGA